MITEANMYNHLIRKRDRLELLRGTGNDRLMVNSGNDRDFIRGHETHAAYAADGTREVRPIKPLLFKRIADARTMHVACRDLESGGGAPGPNGKRLEHLYAIEKWSLSRALAKAVRNGRYLPGGRRKVRVPKSNGGGFRQIQISDIEDRIVDRAALRIIQPVLDPQFSPFSFGFRPRLGPMNALAAGLALAQSRGHWCWAMADIANAFDSIPHKRFLDVCDMYLPDDVIELVSIITKVDGAGGLPQGSPVAPLLANLYFHHFLDRPWHRRHPGTPLLRYADDLAVMAGSMEEAQSLHEAMTVLARSAGTPLKKASSPTVVNLSSGHSAQWLGFRIRLEDGEPVMRLTEKAWAGLVGGFVEANLGPCSPIRALSVVRGWIDQIGPCFPAEDQDAVATRIRASGADNGFSELPLVDDLVGLWQRSYARWARLRAVEAGRLVQRLEAIPGMVRGASDAKVSATPD